MKIYEIAMLMLCINLSLALFGATGAMPSVIETSDVFNESYFEGQVGQTLAYSDSDISIISFGGDFLKSLARLGEMFVMAPTMLSQVLYSVGCPAEIATVLKTLTYLVYAVGGAQILMRYSIKGNE